MFPELITELLQDGYKVNFSAPGHSMYPTILANETILVEPIAPGTVRLGDIVLYRTNGRLVAHRVIRIDKDKFTRITDSQYSKNRKSYSFIEGDSPLRKRSSPQVYPVECGADYSGVKRSSNAVLEFVLRGDAALACDDPVKAGQILGKVVSIERNGRTIDPYCYSHKLTCLLLSWANRIKRLITGTKKVRQ